MTAEQIFLLWLILLAISSIFIIRLIIALIVDYVKNYKRKKVRKNGKQRRTNNRSRI